MTTSTLKRWLRENLNLNRGGRQSQPNDDKAAYKGESGGEAPQMDRISKGVQEVKASKRLDGMRTYLSLRRGESRRWTACPLSGGESEGAIFSTCWPVNTVSGRNASL